jgi:hypothetical protein
MLSKKNFEVQAFGLALIVLLLPGCNSKGCYEDMSVRLYANFYTIDTDDGEVAVSVDSLSVWGVGTDSLLYDNADESGLELILNPNSQQTQYVVAAVQDGYIFVDTLTFDHTNEPWFQSMECGCRVFSTLTGCRTKGIIFQSAVIADSSVNNLESEHVKLYL